MGNVDWGSSAGAQDDGLSLHGIVYSPRSVISYDFSLPFHSGAEMDSDHSARTESASIARFGMVGGLPEARDWLDMLDIFSAVDSVETSRFADFSPAIAAHPAGGVGRLAEFFFDLGGIHDLSAGTHLL